jgi:hypothetical protein
MVQSDNARNDAAKTVNMREDEQHDRRDIKRSREVKKLDLMSHSTQM